jgi:hypothetical protein
LVGAIDFGLRGSDLGLARMREAPPCPRTSVRPKSDGRDKPGHDD